MSGWHISGVLVDVHYYAERVIHFHARARGIVTLNAGFVRGAEGTQQDGPATFLGIAVGFGWC
jgi:hypothetical protein